MAYMFNGTHLLNSVISRGNVGKNDRFPRLIIIFSISLQCINSLIHNKIAVSLLKTEANMAITCSVNANGQTVECLRFLNRSQFVTSSSISVCSV